MQARVVSVVAVALIAGACSGGDDDAASTTVGPATSTSTAATSTTLAATTTIATITIATTIATTTTTTEPPPSPLDVFDELPSARETLWTRPEPMLAVPLLADGVVIALTAEGDDQVLLGIDPTTGTDLWRRPWGRSALFRGFRNSPRVTADGLIVGLEDRPSGDDGENAAVVGIDPSNGETVWESAELTTSNPPSLCREREFVCLAAAVGDGGNSLLAIDASTGAIVAQGALQDEDVTMGDRLVLRAGSSRTSVLRYDETHQNIEWRLDQTGLFGAAPVASRYGFGADIDEASGVVVLQFGLGPRQQPEIYRRDFETAIHAGVDLATGEVVWREVGSSPSCVLDLPEPDVDDVESRCRHTGVIEFELQDDGSYPFAGRNELTTRLEIFDPATGEVISSLDSFTLPPLARDDEFEADPRFYGAALDGAVVTIGDSGAAFGMAWETGEVVAIDEALVAWCPADGFEIEDSIWSARGGHVPCDVPSFDITDTAAPSRAPSTVGVDHEGITVYLGEGVLVALAPA